MARRMNWERRRQERLGTEPAFPARAQAKGAWTHVKREPVRIYTAEAIAAWERARRDEGGDNG